MSNACRCSAPIADYRYACETCAAIAKADLTEAAPFLRWLDAKRARVGAIRLDTGSPSAEQPLPYDARVTAIARPVINSLTTWARLHQEEHFDHPQPPVDLAELALWLAGSVEWAASRPWASDAFDEYQAALSEMRRLYDVPPDREAIGECGADLGERVCREFLTAEVGAERHACPHCGAEHDVRERRAELIKQAEDISVTVTEAVRLLRINGNTIDKRMIHAVIRVVGIPASDGLRQDRSGRWQRASLYRLGTLTDAIASLEHDGDRRRAVNRVRRGGGDGTDARMAASGV